MSKAVRKYKDECKQHAAPGLGARRMHAAPIRHQHFRQRGAMGDKKNTRPCRRLRSTGLTRKTAVPRKKPRAILHALLQPSSPLPLSAYLHENKPSTDGFPVAHREGAQVEPHSTENSRHHALPVERRPCAPRCAGAHLLQLAAHGLVVLLPVHHLGRQGRSE